MKIFWSHYQLKPLYSLNCLEKKINKREGVLLKIEFAPGQVGYSDCHPLLFMGDPDWQEQLQSLREDRPLPLIARSLELAQWEASHREKEKSIFPPDSLLISHYLLLDPSHFSVNLLEQIVEQNYSVIKLKMGREGFQDWEFLRRLLPIIPENFKFRLDFNLSSNPDELDQNLSRLGTELSQHLDYIEDPFPYDVSDWYTFYEKWQIPLALDQVPILSSETDLSAAQVLVMKPNRIIGDSLENGAKKWGHKRWVFTHSMDHPVGRMLNLGFAMNFYQVNPEKNEIGGFESGPCYERTLFDDQIFQEGSTQLGTEGVGVGFTQLLEDQPWKEI